MYWLHVLCSYVALSASFEYLCYVSTAILIIKYIYAFSTGIDFRRQILTSKSFPAL